MKIILCLLLTSMIITSCSKTDNEIITDFSYNWITYKGVSLAVINNTLAFENENDMYSLYDSICNFNEEQLNKFEHELGFISYRTFFKENKNQLELFNDEHATTLLNPEQSIIVGDKLIKDRPETNSIEAIDMELLKSSYLIKDIKKKVERDFDIFSDIEEDKQLYKSTSSGDTDKFGPYEITETEFPIKYMLEYNKGLFKNIKVTMSRTWIGGIEEMGWASSLGEDSFYKENNSCGPFNAWNSTGTFGLNCNYKRSVKSLISFKIVVDFWVRDPNVLYPPISAWARIARDPDNICTN